MSVPAEQEQRGGCRKPVGQELAIVEMGKCIKVSNWRLGGAKLSLMFSLSRRLPVHGLCSVWFLVDISLSLPLATRRRWGGICQGEELVVMGEFRDMGKKRGDLSELKCCSGAQRSRGASAERGAGHLRNGYDDKA